LDCGLEEAARQQRDSFADSHYGTEFTCLVLGIPPPPFVCKIQKTRNLFCDYVLDL
jgi:hypothetical protein